MKNIQIGDYVTAFYKTGKYIGEVTGERPGAYVVKILSVLKHPRQGDLHNPQEVDVPIFHERKALAHREQANMPEKMVKPFDGNIPDYNESLVSAYLTLKKELAEDPTPHAKKSLETLGSIQREYELMYSLTF
ncbi:MULTISPECIES: kinase-associated lipoprotein B [Rossellomorea]|jgi:kinase-associated protein B|uniref:kinase-associated lipoprotein B n=1 Tax=Rossellomorea TaxID=2837508 RepID=UPI0011E8E204|nr:MULTISPECIES: kinase-associated lipoprotein B [Rossellomorea]MDT9026164.1 kinase-associated lipoprotein B [Rossellomorea sp. YC4-1]TYS89010.1 kinase [Rossellomorea aquimaris]